MRPAFSFTALPRFGVNQSPRRPLIGRPNVRSKAEKPDWSIINEGIMNKLFAAIIAAVFSTVAVAPAFAAEEKKAEKKEEKKAAPKAEEKKADKK